MFFGQHDSFHATEIVLMMMSSLAVNNGLMFGRGSGEVLEEI